MTGSKFANSRVTTRGHRAAYEREPVRKMTTTYAGMDAHAATIRVAVLAAEGGRPEEWQLTNEPRSVKRLAQRLKRMAPGPVVACYKVGPNGVVIPTRAHLAAGARPAVGIVRLLARPAPAEASGRAGRGNPKRQKPSPETRGQRLPAPSATPDAPFHHPARRSPNSRLSLMRDGRSRSRSVNWVMSHLVRSPDGGCQRWPPALSSTPGSRSGSAGSGSRRIIPNFQL